MTDPCSVSQLTPKRRTVFRMLEHAAIRGHMPFVELDDQSWGVAMGAAFKTTRG